MQMKCLVIIKKNRDKYATNLVVRVKTVEKKT